MNRSTLRAGAAACVVVLALAGCSQDDKNTGGTAADSPYLKDAQALVQSALKPQTFDDLKPKTPAPPFTRGKRIAVIMSTATATPVQLQTKAFEEAAAAVGWTTVEFNGLGTNQGKINAMRTALTQKFDGIYMVTVDQRIVTDPMKQAHDLGIPVVSSLSGNQPGDDPTQVFAEVGLDGVVDGKKVASWVISDAAANNVKPEVAWLQNPVNEVVIARDKGMTETFKACGKDCDVDATDTYTSAEAPQVLPQRIQALLQSHPTVNYVIIDIGGFATYVTQGIKQLGPDIAKKVKLISFDCVPDQIQRIVKKDVDVACSGAGSEYAGWAAVDELNRAFNKQKPAGDQVPVQLVTADNYSSVTRPEVGFTGGFDYKSAWKAYWGVQT